MFKVENKKIFITKGDSAAIKCCIRKSDGTPYIMQAGDTLTLTVKQHVEDESELISITSTSNIIDFLPAHTKSLNTGSYYCDIELKIANDIYTVFGLDVKAEANFIISKEVNN